MFGIDHFAELIPVVLRKIFPIDNKLYEVSSDEIVLRDDLDGKTLRDWSELKKAHLDVNRKAEELRNLILKVVAQRELYWRDVLDKNSDIFDFTARGFVIGIRRDKDGRIVLTRSILPLVGGDENG